MLVPEFVPQLHAMGSVFVFVHVSGFVPILVFVFALVFVFVSWDGANREGEVGSRIPAHPLTAAAWAL